MTPATPTSVPKPPAPKPLPASEAFKPRIPTPKPQPRREVKGAGDSRPGQRPACFAQYKSLADRRSQAARQDVFFTCDRPPGGASSGIIRRRPYGWIANDGGFQDGHSAATLAACRSAAKTDPADSADN